MRLLLHQLELSAGEAGVVTCSPAFTEESSKSAAKREVVGEPPTSGVVGSMSVSLPPGVGETCAAYKCAVVGVFEESSDWPSAILLCLGVEQFEDSS